MSSKVSLKLLVLVFQLTASLIGAENFEQKFIKDVVEPYSRGVNYYTILANSLEKHMTSENLGNGNSCLKPVSRQIIDYANHFRQEINNAMQGIGMLVNTMSHRIVAQTAQVSQQETEISNTVQAIKNLQDELYSTIGQIDLQQREIQESITRVDFYQNNLRRAEDRLRKAQQCLGISYVQNYFWNNIGDLFKDHGRGIGKIIQERVCESINLITRNINNERNSMNNARNLLSRSQTLLNELNGKRAQLLGHIHNLESSKAHAIAREQSLRHDLNILRKQQGEAIIVSENTKNIAFFLASLGINADALSRVIDFQFLFDADHILFPMQEIERICRTNGVQVSLPMSQINTTSQSLKNLAALVKTRPELMMPCE